MGKICCLDCGWRGDISEVKKVQESRGEFWGMPAYETMYYCPLCGSEALADAPEMEGETE